MRRLFLYQLLVRVVVEELLVDGRGAEVKVHARGVGVVTEGVGILDHLAHILVGLDFRGPSLLVGPEDLHGHLLGSRVVGVARLRAGGLCGSDTPCRDPLLDAGVVVLRRLLEPDFEPRGKSSVRASFGGLGLLLARVAFWLPERFLEVGHRLLIR